MAELRYEDKIAEIRRMWAADFAIAANEMTGEYEPHVRIIDGDGEVLDSFNFYWVAENLEVGEDNGKRELTTAEVFDIGVSSTRYRTGFRVDADDWRTHGIGELHRGRVMNLGRRPAITKNRVFWNFLTQGNTGAFGLAYDGQNMFDTDHPAKTLQNSDTTHRNLYALPLTAANFNTVITEMTDYTDTTGMHSGNTWGMTSDGRPNVQVIAGNKYQSTLREIFNNERDSAGASNEFFHTAEWAVSPHLSGVYEDYWFVRCRPVEGNEENKPLLYHEPYAPEFIEVMDLGSKTAFDLHAYEFGVNFRFGYSYYSWMSTAMSTTA
jgi:phage major head subunit gpT-like protein